MAQPLPVRDIEALVSMGRTPEAVLLLNRFAAAGNSEAIATLGVWRLEGRLMPRDLRHSRELFGRAAELGHLDAARAYAAFLANGTGGSSSWSGAVALLRKWAPADPQAARQLQLLARMSLTEQGDPETVPEGEIISTSPHVLRFPALFSSAECKFLIEQAEPLFQRAAVVDPATGRFVQDPIRTSDSAAFPWMAEAPAIHALNRRIAAASGTAAAQGEPLQVLRYRPGQQYKPHLDAVPGLDNQRFTTALVYLNEGYSGGETRFLSTGLTVAGKTGDSIIFRNTRDDGQPDQASQHAGLPVSRGVKILASRWIRERPLQASAPQPANR